MIHTTCAPKLDIANITLLYSPVLEILSRFAGCANSMWAVSLTCQKVETFLKSVQGQKTGDSLPFHLWTLFASFGAKHKHNPAFFTIYVSFIYMGEKRCNMSWPFPEKNGSESKSLVRTCAGNVCARVGPRRNWLNAPNSPHATSKKSKREKLISSRPRCLEFNWHFVVHAGACCLLINGMSRHHGGCSAMAQRIGKTTNS